MRMRVDRYRIVQNLIVDKKHGKRITHDIAVAEITEPRNRSSWGENRAAESYPHHVVSLVVYI